jgi:hypothetical protein
VLDAQQDEVRRFPRLPVDVLGQVGDVVDNFQDLSAADREHRRVDGHFVVVCGMQITVGIPPSCRAIHALPGQWLAHVAHLLLKALVPISWHTWTTEVTVTMQERGGLTHERYN